MKSGIAKSFYFYLALKHNNCLKDSTILINKNCIFENTSQIGRSKVDVNVALTFLRGDNWPLQKRNLKIGLKTGEAYCVLLANKKI